jgi:hypothetical protein
MVKCKECGIDKEKLRERIKKFLELHKVYYHEHRGYYGISIDASEQFKELLEKWLK